MSTRRNVLLYVLGLVVVACASFHYGQWSLFSTQEAVRKLIPATVTKNAPALKSKPALAKYTEC